jgi:LytR cell envelope-related transcriptional attenuator
VEHAQTLPAPFPWRALAVVAVGIALIELVALLALTLVRLAPHSAPAHTVSTPAQRHVQPPTVVHRAPTIPSVPLRLRSHVRVLVLNGNGVGGAAAAQAARLRAEGYVIGGATNAQRHDYARSMVMFVPGWVKEARRLARDAGIRMVAPLDGLGSAQLKGAKVVLLLGT